MYSSRLSARAHLLGLIAAAIVPVWLFAAYLLAQYAFQERDRFERDALQTARQASLVVEGELTNIMTMLDGLSKSAALAQGNLTALRDEAIELVGTSDRVIVLRDLQNQLINTYLQPGAALPEATPLSAADLAKYRAGKPIVSGAYVSPVAGDVRIAISVPVRGPPGTDWMLAITAPTARIRDVLMPAVPEGWTIAVGDRAGAYVARSKQHEETTGKPGLPEYVEQVVGTSGTFTSHNFQGTTLLAGYYRSSFSDWFYAANIPLSVVEAPLWNSLAAIGALALLAMLISVLLAYVMGKGITRAAGDLAARADALGHGRPVEPVSTSIAEFAVIADALIGAEHTIRSRANELEAVLETVPAAVWFTYDPRAREVIRNRFAATLMGLPVESQKAFGTPDHVIDTIARKDGQTVSRDDRPLTRAMRGEQTDNEEFIYVLLDGTERVLLTSARSILEPGGTIIGAVQISLDITERKRGEEQRKLLVNELNHRVKNSLAVVQSIATQTLRSAPTLAAAEKSLSSRLISLAKAHDILTQENWSGADLRELVATSLSPHAASDRFELSGPAVWLRPSLALSLALAVHELTTNAIKYGAFSTDVGTISIAWEVGMREDARHLRIVWRERGGPSVVPAERKGFGTRMLERVIDAEPGGSVELAFEPSGLVCVFEVDLAPAANLAQTA